MIRSIISILLIIVGVVAIAGGVWGLSLQQSSQVDPNLLGAAETVLNYADSAMQTIDGAVSGSTDGKLDVTGLLNNLVGDKIDLTDKGSVERFAFLYATEILLGGIIGVQTGLLLRKYGRR